ncbi:MAG: proton-conducting transporter membrane subunit [bacterium]|nr:proton-conducting transporter membrane subunit [bacterium]
MEILFKLFPEIILTISIIFNILIVSISKKTKELKNSFLLVFVFSIVFTIAALFLQLYFIINQGDVGSLSLIINNIVIYDIGSFEVISKIMLSIIAIILTSISSIYFNLNKEEYEHRYFKLEYLPLFLTVLLGSFVLVSASDLLTFLIGFELVAVPSYFVIALDNKNKIALEGSIKYFLIGSISTISIIFGILIFYIFNEGFLYHVNFSNLNLVSLKLAFLFIFIGIILKLGVFPFSFWIQDAYYASRTPYLLLISTLPKYSVTLALVKILSYIQDGYFKVLISVLAVLSMVISVFWALNENDIKKIIAYSTIFNMGFVLIPFTGFSFNIQDKIYILSLVNFYVFQYVLSAILILGVLLYLEEKYDTTDIIKLRGALNNNKVLAFLLVLGLLSTAGLPPTIGFIAKFLVLAFSYKFNPILVLIAIIFSVASLYYYYRIAKELYVEKSFNFNNDLSSLDFSLGSSFLYYASLFSVSILLIILGFIPYFITNTFYLISITLTDF